MKIDVIIQARMGSTRLPGKVLKDLKGKPIIWHVIERVKQSKLIDDVIIATTTSKQDNQIVEFCVDNNIKYYRGSEENVLERYYETAKHFDSDIVLRVTSDCPLIDPKVIDDILEFYLKNNYDLVTNAGMDLANRTFPRGLDIEIFSIEILEKAYVNAKKKYELEHVSPYIYENKFDIYYFKNQQDYSKYRLTLDTIEDYKLIEKIYDELYDSSHNFYMEDIIELLISKPKLYLINNKIKQKKVRI
jgi:spore coat polysaccharide biosynthesis protein SpsF